MVRGCGDIMWVHWLAFGLLLFLIPTGTMKLYLCVIKKNNLTEEQKKIASKNMIKLILFYWLCDFFYMFSFNNWLIAQYVLGLVIIAIIFMVLSQNVTHTKKNNFSKYGMLLDFVIGLGISIYLLYLVPNDKGLRDILIPIVSAVYGGLITLAGVAWTIKWTNENNLRQRKEEVRPLFYGGAIPKSDNIKLVYFNISKDDKYRLTFGRFKNTDKVAFTIVSIILGGITYLCTLNSVIDKGELFCVITNTDDKVEKIPEFIMNIKTIDGDMVSYKVTINTELGLVENVEEIVYYGGLK